MPHSDAGENAATHWFGPAFDGLHPLLQALHREGGILQGEVDVCTGRGIAGLLGRRLARKLGIPVDRPRRGFQVQIRQDNDVMSWHRRFDDGSVMSSVFRPVGRYPDGHWLETTGPVQLTLAVDIVDGGWRWRLLGIAVRGLPLPLPLALFPRVEAFKCVEGDGRYRFGVAFVLFPFGALLRYEGVLQPILHRTNDDKVIIDGHE